MLAETIVVPIGSPASVLSVWGIIFLIICLGTIATQKVKGWITVLNFAIFGMVWVGLNTPNITTPPIDDGSPGYYPHVWHGHQWQSKQYLMYKEGEYLPEHPYEQPWLGAERYAMHVTGGISPRLYHPDAWYWAPIIALGVGLLCSPGWLIFSICGVAMFKSVRR